jgi:hypothetical protein
MKPMRWVVGLATLTLGGAIVASASNQPRREPFAGILDEHPAIRYAETPAQDRVAKLVAEVDAGSRRLPYEEPAGYLRALLNALDISPHSQLLVFSKTGIQRAHTSPLNPRALYFNDSVVVGFIPGARYIEIVAQDARQGMIFYTVDQLVAGAPAIERRTNCLTCHVSGSTLDVPGLITRSNFTHANGEVIPQLGFHLVDHRTPLSQRWGGWFVSGNYDLAPYGGVTHMGNVATALHPSHGDAAGTSNEIWLRWKDSDAAALGYASHESDIAALMLFDHQSRAMNLMTRLHWQVRVAAHDGTIDFVHEPLRSLVNQLADYLLFTDEVAPPARLTPHPRFAAHFVAQGPRDARGRSLRELDLETRLLKFRCSYMIYSPAFDALPAAARHAVYRRMQESLRDENRGHDRRILDEILRATKPDWPAPDQ